MLSGFVFNLQQAGNALLVSATGSVAAEGSRALLMPLLGVGTLVEAAALVFAFYWAPWLAGEVAAENERPPFELAFACCVMAAMLGNYLFVMHSSSSNGQQQSLDAPSAVQAEAGVLQALLVGCAAAFLAAAALSTALLSFAACLAVQLATGVYWPCIGSLRARLLPHDLRAILLLLQK